jgi:hypothetical protein
MIRQLFNLTEARFANPQRGRVYSPYGIAPTLNGIGRGGNLEPKVVIYYDL